MLAGRKNLVNKILKLLASRNNIFCSNSAKTSEDYKSFAA